MYSNYKKYQSLYTVYYYFRIRAKEVTPCSFFYINLEYNIASVTQNVFQKFKIVYKSNCNAKKYVYKDVFLYVTLQSMSTKTYILSHKIELKAITTRKYKVKKHNSRDVDYAAQSGPRGE